MAVSLKYLRDFWITLEMSLISCEINFIVTWSSDRIICSATGATEFVMTDTKLYVSVVSFLKKDNAKLLLQLQLGIKRTINWNKYQSKVSIERQNHYLDYLIDPSFLGVNRLFVLSSEDLHIWTRHTEYFLPKLEIKDYNVMVNGQNFFDQPGKSDMRTYDNIQKIATGQEDDCTTGFLLDYSHFNEHYNLIPIDLSKQQPLDADTKVIEQINFTGN